MNKETKIRMSIAVGTLLSAWLVVCTAINLPPAPPAMVVTSLKLSKSCPKAFNYLLDATENSYVSLYDVKKTIKLRSECTISKLKQEMRGE